MGRISFRPVCYWAFIFSSAVILSGCVPEEEKTDGYKLYSAKCSVCHRLLPPEDYSLDKLNNYIDKYGKELALDEKDRLRGYLRDYLEYKLRKVS